MFFIKVLLLIGFYKTQYVFGEQSFLGYSRMKYRHSTYVPQWAYEDFVSRYDKFKLKRIARELVEESILKMNQVEMIISRSSSNIAFNVGLIMGLIRDKYKKMLGMFRTLHDKRSGRSLLHPPAYELEEWVEKNSKYPRSPMRNIHYIIQMEYMHTQYLEIAALVDVLQRTPKNFYVYEGFGKKSKEIKSLGHPILDALMIHDPVEYAELCRLVEEEMKATTRRPRFIPTFTASTITTTTGVTGYIRGPHGPPPPTRFPPEGRRMEEEYKRDLRQKYLMKRLGFPQEYGTKKKRFQLNWPVDGTWSFEDDNKKK